MERRPKEANYQSDTNGGFLPVLKREKSGNNVPSDTKKTAPPPKSQQSTYRPHQTSSSREGPLAQNGASKGSISPPSKSVSPTAETVPPSPIQTPRSDTKISPKMAGESGRGVVLDKRQTAPCVPRNVSKPKPDNTEYTQSHENDRAKLVVVRTSTV